MVSKSRNTCICNTITVWLRLWMLLVAVSKPALSATSAATSDDTRCSSSGFNVAFSTATSAWYSASKANTVSADGFAMRVDVPLEDKVGGSYKEITSGSRPMYLMTGSSPTSIQPQSIGFRFENCISFRTVVDLDYRAWTTFSEFVSQSCIFQYVFLDFPTVGVNSTIGSQSFSPNTEDIITGGTRAFKGVTGEITYFGVDVDYNAFSFGYANGFEPVC